MPEHCLVESNGEMVMMFVSGTVLLMQLASAYSSISLLFSLPPKRD